jgi:uncharacterized protein (TIGR02117 family)
LAGKDKILLFLKKKKQKDFCCLVLAAVSVVCVGGCAMWTGKNPAGATATPKTHIVYVVGRGYHTDIGLNTGDLSGLLADVARAFPGAQSVLIGFGDRTFVTTRDKWLGTWLLSLFPGRGAMLVTGLRVAPDAAFGRDHAVALHVSGAQFAAIEAFIAASFAGPDFIAKGPYEGSRFYAAARTYDLLDTCNTWTMAALRSGGLPAHPSFTLFASQAMGQAHRLEASGY